MGAVRRLLRQVKWLRQGRRGLRRWLLRRQGIDWVDPEVRCEWVFVGTEYGGRAICPRLLGPDSVTYCAGVGTDASFSLGLIARFGVTVHAFDPTPRSLAWVRAQTWPPQWVFHPVGLADFDGTAHFAPPANEHYVSFAMTDSPTPGSVAAPVRRLPTLTRELGHTCIDLLKLDIEGAEYPVLADLLASDLRPGQLLVEFEPPSPDTGWQRTRQTVADLRRAGYRVFHCSFDGLNVEFVRQDLLPG